MIRHDKPEKVVEIGSGNSTKFVARACLMNETEGVSCALIAIEPFPDNELRNGFPRFTRLIEDKVPI